MGRFDELKARHSKLLGEELSLEDIQEVWRLVELPKLKYGYAQKRLSWQNLKRIILSEKNLAKLSRSCEQQREYEVFRHFLKLKFCSAMDYILISKLGFEKDYVDECWKATKLLHPSAKKVVVENDFPYFTERGIIHYILWKAYEDITEDDIVDAKHYLKSELNACETLHWTNPPHLKSLPEIDHVHILCLLDEETI